MIDIKSAIENIESLVSEDTDRSLTYAALECRLLIERICYDRLRFLREYISDEDLKGWQPGAIVKTLIQEIDPGVGLDTTLSISELPADDDSHADPSTLKYVVIGTQVGINAKILRDYWNALSNTALHASIPKGKHSHLPAYGSKIKIKSKVESCLQELRRLGRQTISTSPLSSTISYQCVCGRTNKRQLAMLYDGKVTTCTNHECKERYSYSSEDKSFDRMQKEVKCGHCSKEFYIQEHAIMSLERGKSFQAQCPWCSGFIVVAWRLYQATVSKLPE